MSDYPMLISNKLHSFRNFPIQSYDILDMHQHLNRHFLCYIHFFYFYNNRQAPQNATHPDGNPSGCAVIICCDNVTSQPLSLLFRLHEPRRGRLPQ